MSKISFNKQKQCKNQTGDVHGHVIGLLNILNQKN